MNEQCSYVKLNKATSFITSLLEQFLDGDMMEKFLTYSPIQEIICTKLKNLQKKKPISSIRVSSHKQKR